MLVDNNVTLTVLVELGFWAIITIVAFIIALGLPEFMKLGNLKRAKKKGPDPALTGRGLRMSDVHSMIAIGLSSPR